MEKESFEDQEVAGIMNDNFISIKVDREERPDVDQVYMQASYAIHGNGGWPLNVIALPDGKPVYAGTYFQKEKWKQLLQYFAELYGSQADMLNRQAAEITSVMRSYIDSPFREDGRVLGPEEETLIIKRILERIDFDKGGMLGAPKFPMPVVFEFLLYFATLKANDKALQAVSLSLGYMASGGIYDHLGGGFFRYSTDDKWHVPHFEKMLYDNAQLVSLYAHAYMINKNPLYEKVVRETIRFVSDKLSNGRGAFYSALDADSEGQEGKHYVWTRKEIEAILGKDASGFCERYNISDAGNWEHGLNILHGQAGKIAGPDHDKHIIAQRQKLLAAREKREQPGLDNKVLTSWNALMLLALSDAYRALGDEQYLDMAMKNASFLESQMLDEDYSLYRNYVNGKASINAFLDDYAFLIKACISLYQLSFDEHWLYLSYNMSKYVLKNFYDSTEKRFHYNSAVDPALVIRPAETDDNVIPSSMSVMVSNATFLGHYFNDNALEALAKESLSVMVSGTLKAPVFRSNWAQQMIAANYPVLEVGIIGPDSNALRNSLLKHYLPGIILYGGKKIGTLSNFGYKYIEGKTLIYVCADKSCFEAVETLDEAIELINTVRRPGEVQK
jgi:uncharacterized protein YyaL (SSP411 family)